MENGSRILKNLNTDVDQVLTSTTQNQLINENDTDLIRRRRLERLANKSTSSPSTEIQDDNNTNNNA
jgi:hypothetical protein